MIILGFESTAKVASVALSDNDKILAHYRIDNGNTQSELLLPMAESILKSTGLSFSDIDVLAAAVGPGSFTGVRIGVSVVKGLAFGKGTPTVAVSSLEALAENARGLSGIIVAAMDARRNQVYYAIFSSKDGELTRQTDDGAISVDELISELLKYRDESIYVVGDGYALLHRASAGKLTLAVTPDELILQNAISVCKIAKRKYEMGEYTSDLEISPKYLRLPQAERERLEREKQK